MYKSWKECVAKIKECVTQKEGNPSSEMKEARYSRTWCPQHIPVILDNIFGCNKCVKMLCGEFDQFAMTEDLEKSEPRAHGELNSSESVPEL